MCSMNDDPTTYDAPEPIRPRTYRLSGDAPSPLGRGSVALAVLGEMLNDAENAAAIAQSVETDPMRRTRRRPGPKRMRLIVEVLREARDRVAAAEAQHRTTTQTLGTR